MYKLQYRYAGKNEWHNHDYSEINVAGIGVERVRVIEVPESKEELPLDKIGSLS